MKYIPGIDASFECIMKVQGKDEYALSFFIWGRVSDHIWPSKSLNSYKYTDWFGETLSQWWWENPHLSHNATTADTREPAHDWRRQGVEELTDSVECNLPPSSISVMFHRTYRRSQLGTCCMEGHTLFKWLCIWLKWKWRFLSSVFCLLLAPRISA